MMEKIHRLKAYPARVAPAMLLASLIIVACSPSPPQSAPPVPHKATEELCVTCHREGKDGAPKMKHASRGSCGNCHASTR